MKILIDSIDKRMTVPLINQLASAGYTVCGMGFSGGQVLNDGPLSVVHEIDKSNIVDSLSIILSEYSEEDILLVGNPLVMDAVLTIKPKIRYILPSQESISKANDKMYLGGLSSELEIPYPMERDQVSVGTIVKLKCSENTSLKPAQRYRIIETEAALEKAQDFLIEHEGNLIIQDYVSGDGYGVSMLLDEKSELVDYICHRRLLEYPISGGPSALCESIYDQVKVENAYKLLKALDWKGFAMVEFKGDHLIEINPRFWGSMPLIFRAQSDFFISYIKIIGGQSIELNGVPYKVGVKMSYFPQGLIAVISHFKAGNMKNALKGLAALINSREGIFRLSKPGPFFKYVKGLFRR